MSAKLHVLLLEDDDSDAELVVRTLEKEGTDHVITRVTCRCGFEEALGPDFDVVLANDTLPDCDALQARALMEERDLDVPLIVVTGNLGEEHAAGCVRRGCADYVRKDNLTRLPTAVSNAMEQRRLSAQRREAECHVRYGELRFRAIVENATEAIVLLDADGRILDSYGTPLLGYGHEETVGQSTLDLVHPEDAPRIREALGILVAQPQSVCTTEARWAHRSGEWVWLDCHAVNLLHEPSVQAMVATFRDVTECPRTLNDVTECPRTLNDVTTIRESVRGSAALLATLDATMALHRTSGDWENAHGALLIAARGLAGSPHAFTMLNGEDSRPNIRLDTDACASADGLQPEALQHIYRSMVESPRPILCTRQGADSVCGSSKQNLAAVPILVASKVLGLLGVSGRPDAYTDADRAQLELQAQTLGIIYDSHLRAQQHTLMERELRQSQKMEAVGRLAGGVAHDFNNLLTAILGYGEMTMHGLEPDSPLAEYVQEVLNAGERAASLTRQLLTLSRRQVVAPERLSVNQVLGSLGRILERVIGEDVALGVRTDPDLPAVLMDPGQLEQVVMNLVVNARDAMPQGGRITLETSAVRLDKRFAAAHPGTRAGEYAQLTVEDTGCGMGPDVLSHLFEPFFTTKGVDRGTGLGLSTVYGIVKQAGGDVRVESEVGRGTCFHVLLPANSAPAESAPLLVAPPSVEGRGETVLVVEDSEGVRRMARLILEEHGYRVLEASCGTDALATCRSHISPLHLLLTDVVLPGMSGHEVAQAVTASRPDTRVLFMSGYTDDALLNAGLRWQDVNLLQKPFTQAALLRKVREVLEQERPQAVLVR